MTRGGRIDPMRFPNGALDADERIDIAIAESFPASDPPSWNSGVETKFEWKVSGIIAATDLSDCARNALDHAIALSRATGAGLTVVHARRNAPEYDDLYRPRVAEARSRTRYSALYVDSFDARVEPAFDQQAATALARTHHHQLDGLSHVRQVAVAGEPVETILDAAQSAGATIIVVGSHGRRGLAEVFLGSTAEAVIRRSPLPVLAVACGAPAKDGGDVVAVLDEPEVADDIVLHAAELATVLQAKLVTLRVPNDGRVDRRAELGNARIVVIAFPRDTTRKVSGTDPNVHVLLRSGRWPVLTIPVS